MADSSDIINAFRDFLRYKAECGERTVELEPETWRSLVSAAQAAKTGERLKVEGGRIQESGFRNQGSGVGVQESGTAVYSQQSRTSNVGPSASSHQPESSILKPESSLADIAARCGECRACVLCEKRQHVVPGQGNADSPDIMFIGEAPGADEDAQGLAFVGRAGELLTKMIAAMGYTRDEVFIANICKCRPPNNRTPSPEEMAQCIPFLKQQIALIKPKCIVALGNTALLGLLGVSGITRMHGLWKEFAGIPLMPTYHPAYLLRLPAAKRDCWNDLQLVMKKFGRTRPK